MARSRVCNVTIIITRPRSFFTTIVEMIFQLGIQNVLGFKKTLKHIKNNNKFLAALEMMDSIWYKQTPLRVKNLIKHFLKQ